MKDGKVLIWMNLLGFDRDDPDRGCKRFLNQTGFAPDGVGALMCHSDFFNLHRGMDEEYTLPRTTAHTGAFPETPSGKGNPGQTTTFATL
jgi:hypothetical protein